MDIEFPVEQLQLEVGLTLTHGKDPTGQGGAEAEGEVVASCVVVKGYQCTGKQGQTDSVKYMEEGN